MTPRPVVTCFLRADGEVLLLRRSDAVGSYAGRWGGVAGHVAADGEDPTAPDRDPEAAARAEIAEETGLERAVTLVRQGEPFPVEDDSDQWLVYPFLFDCDSRGVRTNAETVETAWVQPPEILRRETVPRLWLSYDRVRPRVATVREDRTHGSSWLSMRALEVLRDEAAVVAEGHRADGTRPERTGDDWDGLAALARSLRDARPSMAVLANRIDRTMLAASDERSPRAVETAASRAVEQACAVDREAAQVAAETLPERIATLSRSGTVSAAIHEAAPEAVLVAESRPGREGVAVAESLAAATDVTLTTDAALAFELVDWDAEAVVVGADRILPDGRVVNKVGTRAAALSAAAADCAVFVAAASDKIAPDDGYDLEPRERTELYDGTADVAVANPTFDVTPADAVTAVLTEQGRLDGEEVRAVAAAHREWTTWDRS
ncbi:NUDIX domain-containing protein [Halomicroarcula sp. GCM10025709]|uniref:NUDIX domain-containing protein n=1 Tax=Haloarcula TaxID=2237 RepID=UPI0024C44214|nr:NUDIX domain-containing protein [Halomicroarcula sp. YJ-61-S]